MRTKLRLSTDTPNVKPINTSFEEQHKRRQEIDELNLQIEALKQEMRQQKNEQGAVNPALYEQLKNLRTQRESKSLSPLQKLEVLISRCPYCSREIWMQIGIFGLTDPFWSYKDSNGFDRISEVSCCPHLFCVDGALNLNEHKPDVSTASDSDDDIRMGAEVPFVKPRVLNLSTMVVVIHSFPIAEKYTAYPIVYFTKQQPDQDDFCVGWAKEEHRVVHEVGSRTVGIREIVGYGRRSDIQDYDLKKWIEAQKLFWLVENEGEYLPINGPVELYPYHNATGRHHPYTIKNGRVRNRKNPTRNSSPTFRWEEW